MNHTTPASPFAVHAAAQRLLRTTARAWRLKPPVRRGTAQRARLAAASSAWAGAGQVHGLAKASDWPCSVGFAPALAGYGFAISY